MRHPSIVLLVSLPLASARAQGAVHVVDDDGGSAVFVEIQAAVDAASDGDVVLVREGGYASFALSGKGVTVVGDTDATVTVAGPIAVDGVPAGSFAVLRGLRTGVPAGHGLRVESCAGAVRVEDCDLVGQDSPAVYEPEVTFHGAYVRDSASVLFARCTLTGGHGANLGFFGEPTSGGSGILAVHARVVVSGCVLTGGHGASSPFDDWYDGGNGGDGVRVWNSELWVSDCTAAGGFGGDGDEDYDPLFGTSQCGDGGRGGSGVRVESFWWPGGVAGSAVVVRGLTAFPGLGGGVICGTPGEAGESISVVQPELHDVVSIPGTARGTWASSPVRGGQNARVYVQGEPGDLAIVAFGAATPLFALPGQPLPFSILAPQAVLVAGALPTGGLLIHPVPIPQFAAGFGGVTLSLQGFVLPTGGPAFEVAPFGTVTLLEQIY